MNKNLTIAIVSTAVIVGGAAFAGGMKYQQMKSPVRNFGANNTAGQAFRAGGNAGRGQGQAGFRPVSGDIIAADAKSITVKLADGSSKIVFLSDKTMINKAATATTAELIVGAKVAAFGTDNSDGSVTAQSIQLNPTNMRIGGINPSTAPTK